jgi:hypothetical protein
MSRQRITDQDVVGFLPPLTFSTEVIVPLAIGVGLIVVALCAKRLGKTSPVQTGLIEVGGISIALAILLWITTAVPIVSAFYVPALFASPWIGLAATLLGLALWGIRRVWLGAYGGLEVIAAMVTIAICAFSEYVSGFQRGIALLGAIYFLVRGLDNVEKGELLTDLRRVPKRVWKYIATAALGAAIVTAFATLLPGPGIEPPYLEGVHGGVLPASATDCGRPFVVCDTAAWIENRRLRAATHAERVLAEREAEQRFDRFVCSTDSRSAVPPPPPEWCSARGYGPFRVDNVRRGTTR